MRPSRLLQASAVVMLCFMSWQRPGMALQSSFEWSAPIDISEPFAEGQDLYGVMLCDAYQTLHVLWGKSRENASQIYYRNDANGSWSVPIDVVATPDPVAVELSAAISERDKAIHLIWQNQWVGGDIYYSRGSLWDAGNPRAWTTPEILLSGIDSAEIHVDADGIVRVAFGASSTTGLENRIYIMSSKDGGRTWDEPVLVFEKISAVPSMTSPYIAVDEAGRIHVGITVRSIEYGAYSEVGYLRSEDGGQTWQPYVRIAEQSAASPNISVIAPYAFGRDEIHLTWDDPRRLHLWSYDGGETWNGPIEIMELGAAFGGANELAKDSAGVLHVVTAVAGGVFSASWDGSRWGEPKQIENRPMDPHAQRIVACQGNQLHVVYDDRHGEETTVWYSTREVNAPHIPQQPQPAPDPNPEAPTTLDIPAIPRVTLEPVHTAASTTPPESSPPTPIQPAQSQLTVLILSIIPAIILVAAVFVFRTRRQG